MSNQGNWQIRSANVDDARRMAEIHVSSWRVAYRGQVPNEHLDSLSVDKRELKFREWIETAQLQDRRVWLISDGVKAFGFADTAPSRDEITTAHVAELCGIYLHPDYWSRGAGRDFLRYALEDLKSRNFTAAILWVLKSNERAIRFYSAAGFTPDGATKDYTFSGVIVPGVRYRKLLD
jgi:ribosomal protein S18 acetylase RimI-like enzyme